MGSFGAYSIPLMILGLSGIVSSSSRAARLREICISLLLGLSHDSCSSAEYSRYAFEMLVRFDLVVLVPPIVMMAASSL